MTAASSVPRSAEPRLIVDGTGALLKVRNHDGGLPFIPDHAHFLSAVADLALARCVLLGGSTLVRVQDLRHPI